jgi:hypothetical protein
LREERAQEVVDEINAWRTECEKALPPCGDPGGDWDEFERIDDIRDEACRVTEFPPPPLGLSLCIRDSGLTPDWEVSVRSHVMLKED